MSNITINDIVTGKLTARDLHLGWVVSVSEKSLQLSYTIRNFSWKSVQDADDDTVNKFLSSDTYANIKRRLERARRKRKSLFYHAQSIADMKVLLDNDNVKIDVDKLVRAKVRSYVKMKRKEEKENRR